MIVATNSTTTGSALTIGGTAGYGDSYISFDVVQREGEGISPIIYFKYIKSKFKFLESRKVEKRLKLLEEAFNEAVENGQDALARKFLNELVIETRETTLLAKGIKYFIEQKDLYKFKHKLYKGHISDTLYSEYTRIIPKKVVEKKKAVEDIFDRFIIFHYFNEEQKDTHKMDREEKQRMRDPVLFGVFAEPITLGLSSIKERYYFIADWTDEYCDLTFDGLLEFMGKDKRTQQISVKPQIK